jgi:hypothetical protein
MRVFSQSQSHADLEEAELEEAVHQQTSIPIHTNIKPPWVALHQVHHHRQVHQHHQDHHQLQLATFLQFNSNVLMQWVEQHLV